MLNSAPLEGRKGARSLYSLPLGPRESPTRRTVSPRQRLNEELLANRSPDHSGAGIQSSHLGAVGYLMHGFVLLFLSIWVLYHFGQVFWFLSIVIAAVGMISVYAAYGSCVA